jgi:hypothetical protein
MQGILITKLYQYMQQNNPELIVQLEETGSLTQYLSDNVSAIENDIADLEQQAVPGFEIEETCMNKLTAHLKPSRYNYILQLLEDDFENIYTDFVAAGILQTETISLVNFCKEVFDDLVFTEEHEDNRFIRYAITGMIRAYLESTSVKENVSDELQQSAKAQRQY